MKNRIRSIAFLTFLILSFAIPAQADVDQQKLDQALEKIASYEYGQPREILTELADLVRAAAANPDDAKLVEKSLLNALNSKTTLAGKDHICRQLFIVGSEESAPVLALMLTDEKTSDMAIYALERIPGDAIDQTLIDALEKTSDKTKIGIINSLGNRKAAKAVTALSSQIYNSDEQIAAAAVIALGKIADAQATEVLAKAKDKTTGQLQVKALNAYLKCADALHAQGKTAEALEIYKEAYAENNPKQIRFAALQGIINASGENSTDVIVDALKSKDAQLQEVAIAAVINVGGEKIIPAVTAQIPNLSPVAQIQLISVLAQRSDAAALPAVAGLTKEAADLCVRLAAIEAIGKLGDASTVDLLVEIAVATKGDEQQVARKSLYDLKGLPIDNRIIGSIGQADPKQKVELIKAAAQRYMNSAVPVLLETAADPDRNVRLESIKALKDLAGPEHAGQLADVLINTKSRSERNEAEKALVVAANKITDNSAREKTVLNKLPSVEDDDIKSSLLIVLGKIGSDGSLQLLRQTLDSDNAKLRTAAIKSLSEWQTAAPAGDLLKIAQSSDDQIDKILALRGYVRLIALDNEAEPKQKVEMYKQAMDMAPNINEKKMVLSALGSVASYNALEMADGYLNEPALLAEAQAAVVQIAESTKGTENPQKTKEILQKVIDQTSNEEMKNRAQKAMDAIK